MSVWMNYVKHRHADSNKRYKTECYYQVSVELENKKKIS